MRFDWLVVGAGFTGAVLAERIASRLGQRVLVIDRRDHVGGNAYDYYDGHGVLVQKYGAHIFHTNSPRIWGYLSRFTSWNPYSHRVRAVIEGRSIPLPFNLNSLGVLFPAATAARMERLLIERYGLGASVPILNMLQEPDACLNDLAQYVYRNVFDGYTRKQWGLSPKDLDASVTGRVPVNVSRDDRYFRDSYQGMPTGGYTAMFHRMLSHPNVCVELQSSYDAALHEARGGRIIFTGPIDEYFGYCFGALPYRSLRFEFHHQERARFQEVAVVNYPNEQAFTRIAEFKHFTGQVLPGTTVAYEYSEQYVPGMNEPYYPVPRESNRERYGLYLREAARLARDVVFAGRLADYKYYNMDQAVGRALKVFDQIVSGEARGVRAAGVA